jgi:DNA excision repair protein ERCC-3
MAAAAEAFPDLQLHPADELPLRPLYVLPNCLILLEAFSPNYKPALDFVIAIAEPVSRPELLHEYRITDDSLFAAVSVGYDPDGIIHSLSRLAKNVIPENVTRLIRDRTSSFGKVSVVLRDRQYLLESTDQVVLNKIFSHHDLSAITGHQTVLRRHADVGEATVIAGTGQARLDAKQEDLTFSRLLPATAAEAASEANIVYYFVISDGRPKPKPGMPAAAAAAAAGVVPAAPVAKTDDADPKALEKVKQVCRQLGYPVLEEYDHHRDGATPDLGVRLRPSTAIRPYQELALEKMFGNGRARSGIIVLPCGAGKTLVGIAAACTLQKPALILCTSSVAVAQWAEQFKKWSTATDDQILQFKSGLTEPGPPRPITISSYAMVTHRRAERTASASVLDRHVLDRDWGVLILDEVHVAAANVFRTVASKVRAHCKLGLSATLVREDGGIEHLATLVGPKLFEANWLELRRGGYIADVLCAEVRCPMPASFYKAYLSVPKRERPVLYNSNPNKLRACEYLIKYHQARGDRILVFSDSLFTLKTCATNLNLPYMCGTTSAQERIEVLNLFLDNRFSTVFLSKVGDNSIDLPDANVLIELSANYGSRRQEAQRLGRVLRPKSGSDQRAFFYTLVSADTIEESHAAHRQRFLVEQGYSYSALTDVHTLAAADASLHWGTEAQRRRLLADALAAGQGSDEDNNASDGVTDTLEAAEMRTERMDMSEHQRKRTAAPMMLSRPQGGDVYTPAAKRRRR